MTDLLRPALDYHDLGLNPLPTIRGKKHPGSWRRWQAERIPREQVERDFARPQQGIWVVTGCAVGLRVVVLDCDNVEAVRWWRDRLNGDLSVAARVRTPRPAWHLWWRLPDGVTVRNSAAPEDAPERWEIRGEGGGVVVPPSEHVDGGHYEWSSRTLDRLIEAPAEFLRIAASAPGVAEPAGGRAEGAGGLENLLANAPVGADSGRNTWLAKVAGHYAASGLGHGSYARLVREANEHLDTPLGAALGDDPREVGKLVDSIWSREDRKFEHAVAEEERRLRVREEARSRLRAELWTPPDATDTLHQELEIPDDPQPEAISELLPADGNGAVVAAGKVGKTSLLVGWARDLADGGPVLGRFVARMPEGRRVAYVNFEMARAQMRAWLRRARIEHADRVCVLNLRGGSNPFETEQGQAFLVDWLATRAVWLWIVDSYAAAFTGDSENDNQQARGFLKLVDEVAADAGVPNTLVLQHTGHGKEERARGAKALGDWPDSIVTVTKDREGRRYMRAVGRDVDLGEGELGWDPRTGTYTAFYDGQRRPRLGPQENMTDAERDTLVVEVVRAHEGKLGKGALMRAMSGSGGNEKRKAAIERCERAGRIVLDGGGEYRLGGQGALDV